MKPQRKIFELEEANALLPRLESLLSGLEKKQDSFRRLQDGLFFEELLAESAPPDEKLQALEEALVMMEEDLERVHELGCLLRHAEKGLVDFLTRRGEQWVYLCWRRGEKQIEYYHTLRGGYFERQRL